MLRQSRYNPKSKNRASDRPLNARATDQEIKKWVLRAHGIVPESAWIAHCKKLFGTPSTTVTHENPCPPEKLPILKQALREFGLLTNDEPTHECTPHPNYPGREPGAAHHEAQRIANEITLAEEELLI